MSHLTLVSSTSALDVRLNSAEIQRVRELFQRIGASAMSELIKNPRLCGDRLEAMLDRVIARQCATILAAGKAPRSAHPQARLAARKALADELRSGRSALRKLKKKAVQHEEALQQRMSEVEVVLRKEMTVRLRRSKERLRKLRVLNTTLASTLATQIPLVGEDGTAYPPMPPPCTVGDKFGAGLPELPGIYFLILNGKVDYVGQSVNLSQRLRLGGHHVLHDRHQIAYLLFNRRELTWAECYYIGWHRPPCNFGKLASHYEDKT